VQGYKGAKSSLADVVVVSIAGGARDYQVRSRMASVELDGILLPTNGLTTSSAGMVNVFMSIEHQSTLSCNQLVMQLIGEGGSTDIPPNQIYNHDCVGYGWKASNDGH